MTRGLLLLLLCLACLPGFADSIPFDKPADYSDWKTESGTWAVSEGALLQTEASLSRAITWRPTRAFSDVDVSVEYFVHPVGDGVRAPGLVYRAADQDNYYYVHFDVKNSQIVWVRSGPGKEWTEARRHPSTELKAGQWQTVRVVCKADEHQVYLDGKLLFTEKDATITDGVLGLRAGQAKVGFRNLNFAGTAATLDKPFKVQQAPYSVVCSDAGAGAYEAFPDLCLTKAGELLCVFYAGYGHVSVPNEKLPKGARIAMCRSTDFGKTWSPAETVVDTAIDDRDSSITQLSNGDLLVVYMSYDPGRKPGTHQVFTVRSSDNGKTWAEPQRVPTQFDANEAVSEPVREMPDGRLLLPVYGSLVAQPTPRYVVGVLESRDLGKTWQPLSLIQSPQYELCEPSLVRLPDNRLLMLIRPTMTWCESTDGGKTWTAQAPMPVPGDAPYLLLTSKNLLLCGFRHRATSSTNVICSTDFGKTWSEMVTLDRVLGAYASMVELPDGRILVVYYTEGSGSDIRALHLKADEKGVQVLPREEP